VQGVGAGRYAPRGLVERGQMAKFLRLGLRARQRPPLTAAGDYFADDETSVQEDNINKAAEAGFTVGREGRYDAGGTVPRDAMASFLSRALDLLVAEGTTPVRG
jgi:hypothetical protein